MAGDERVLRLLMRGSVFVLGYLDPRTAKQLLCNPAAAAAGSDADPSPPDYLAAPRWARGLSGLHIVAAACHDEHCFLLTQQGQVKPITIKHTHIAIKSIKNSTSHHDGRWKESLLHIMAFD